MFTYYFLFLTVHRYTFRTIVIIVPPVRLKSIQVQLCHGEKKTLLVRFQNGEEGVCQTLGEETPSRTTANLGCFLASANGRRSHGEPCGLPPGSPGAAYRAASTN